MIYGSSRLGTYSPEYQPYTLQFLGIPKNTLTLGYKNYELSNHLGNVLTTISDNYAPQPPTGGVSARVLSSQDYYPFGMAMTENHGSELLDDIPYSRSFNSSMSKSGKQVNFSGDDIKKTSHLKLDDNGFLNGTIQIGDGGKGKGLATAMFRQAERMLGTDKVNGMKATWLKSETIGDNYEAFTKVFNETGDLQKAAFATATGKIAKRMGYTVASPDPRNAVGQIMIYFTKPK